MTRIVGAARRTIVIDARQLRTTTGRYVERLLHHLQTSATDHRYVVLLKPQDIDGWHPTHANFSKLACPFKEFGVGEQIGMLRQLRRLKPDLVHFPMAQQPIFYRGAVVTSILDLTTARCVVPAKRGLAFTIKQAIYRAMVWRVARKSRQIITISDFVRRQLQGFAGIDANKMTTTHLAADAIDDAPEPLAALVGVPFILHVGRALPHKNLAALVDAFVLMRQDMPALRLVIAGQRDAPMIELEQRAARQGLGQCVLFTGFVSQGRLRWLYEHTKAYVFPSLSEGFGLPGLEAMVHGAPVVSSDATCLPEVYRQAAHYFPPTDPAAIAQAITAVLTDADFARALVRHGTRIAAGYSWRRCVSETLAVYGKALDSGAGHGRASAPPLARPGRPDVKENDKK
jgi:glycosyltransferase involved in cell wall biosynthesis